jgi:hypothetical protein
VYTGVLTWLAMSDLSGNGWLSASAFFPVAGVDSSSPLPSIKAGQDTDQGRSSILRLLSAWFWLWPHQWRVQASACKEEGERMGSGWNQRYTEITHDPLLFTSVAQGIF